MIQTFQPASPPLYRCIVDDVRRQIGDGRLAPGERIPTLSQICTAYEVSQITAKRALTELQAVGLVRSVRGKGSFVTDRHRLPEVAGAPPLRGIVLMVAAGSFGSTSEGFFASTAAAIRDAAHAGELSFRIQAIPEGGSDFHLDLAFQPDPAEGLVFLTTSYPYRIMHLVHEQRLPAVTIDAANSFTHAVLSDNLGGMAKLIDYLAGRGHRRLCLAPRHPRSPNPTNENERADAFRFLAADRGLIGEIAPSAEPDWLLRRLRAPRPPSVIMFTQDHAAYSLVHAARAAGVRVPEDVAVTGFDGWSRERDDAIDLTTLAVDRAGLGTRAVEFLLRQSTDPSPIAEWQRVPGSLHVGETA